MVNLVFDPLTDCGGEGCHTLSAVSPAPVSKTIYYVR